MYKCTTQKFLRYTCIEMLSLSRETDYLNLALSRETVYLDLATGRVSLSLVTDSGPHEQVC
jgi:hypothetical protein